jgi:AcrR family transcriptional regulator
MERFMDDRLTKDAWIEHGLKTLATKGSNNIKVGALAAGLNVTRGSFYWHFRDLAEFRFELLRTWKQRATDQVILETEADHSKPNRLKRLLERAFTTRTDLDRAFRSWADTDKDVEAAVAAVDSQRVTYVAQLIETQGVPRKIARSRAIFVYWSFLGRGLAVGSRLTVPPAAIDDLSGILES